MKNKKAYLNYRIIDEYEAGIILEGSEVKSLRLSNLSFTDSYIFISNNEIWVKNLEISKYKFAHPMEVINTKRDRKLLLTKKQINKIKNEIKENGITCVPLGVFMKNNKFKIKIGIVPFLYIILYITYIISG